MEIPPIWINDVNEVKTERRLEADNVSMSSINSSTSITSAKGTRKKLLSRLKKALTSSHQNLTVQDPFALTAAAAAEDSGSNSHPQTPKMKRTNKTMGTMMEYRQTLYQLIATQVEKDVQQIWNGQFGHDSNEKRLLHKLKRQANLSKLESTFIHWEILLEIYQDYKCQLDSAFICTQFDKLVNLFQNWTFRDGGYKTLNKLFWNQAKSLIEKLVAHLVLNCDRVLSTGQDSDDIYNCVRVLEHIKIKNQSELAEQVKISLEELIYKYLEKADVWFTEMMVECDCKLDQNSISTISSLAKLVVSCKTLLDTINQRRNNWTKVFQGLDINLYDVIYSVWDEQLAKLLQRVIPLVASTIKPVNVDGQILPLLSINDADFIVEEDAYKLFLMLREFVSFGNIGSNRMSLVRSNPGSPLLTVRDSYHNLFVPFVVEWINITYLKNLVRTQSAVKLDDLKPITETSKSSSSKVDVVSFLLKINDFWNELSWPTPEESYSFAVVIVKNLDKCISHYGHLITKRVNELDKVDFEKFDISKKQYIALNNIERVQQHAENIIEKLNIPSLVKSPKNAKQCLSTMSTLIENMQQTVHQQIVDIIQFAWVNNVQHMFLMLLNNCAETKSIVQFLEQKEKLTNHFSHILNTVGQKLSTATTFIVYRTLWTNMITSFEVYLESCKGTDAQPLIFQHLQITLFDLEKIFQHEALKEDLNFHINTTDRLLQLKAFLRLQGSSSTDLQIEYLTIRFREQCNADKLATEDKIGRLGIVAKYSRKNQQLRLDILHAVFHNDVPPAYVKFQIITRNIKQGVIEYHYTEYKNSKCQLYEKDFLIDLPSDDWAQGGMIRFWVKHHGRLHARTHVIAEAFLPLESIPTVEDTDTNTSSNNPLQKLTLTWPTQSVSKCDILDVLQNRKSDKDAVKFVKREKCRFGLGNNIFIK